MYQIVLEAEFKLLSIASDRLRRGTRESVVYPCIYFAPDEINVWIVNGLPCHCRHVQSRREDEERSTRRGRAWQV